MGTIAKQRESTVSVTVKLPVDIARLYGELPERISKHLLEQSAVEGYRSRELSRGQVAQMLQLDWEDTEQFLAKHQCDRHYGVDDLDQDRKNLEKIFGTK